MKHYNNCSALYAEVSSDGVPRFLPPSPSPPPRPPRPPPCPPGPSPQPPPRFPSGENAGNPAAQPNPADVAARPALPRPPPAAPPPVALQPYPGVTCNLTLAGSAADFDRADFQQDLVSYLSTAARPLLLADIGAEVPPDGIVAASVDPGSIVVVLSIHFPQSDQMNAERARDALAALLDDGGTRSLDDVLDVTVEQHTLPQLVEFPPPDAPVVAAAPPQAPFSPRPSPPSPPVPPPFCPLLPVPPPAPAAASSATTATAALTAAAPGPDSDPSRSRGAARLPPSLQRHQHRWSHLLQLLAGGPSASAPPQAERSSSRGGTSAQSVWTWAHVTSLLGSGGGPVRREKRSAMFGMYDGITM